MKALCGHRKTFQEVEEKIESELLPCAECGSKAIACYSICSSPSCCGIPHYINCSNPKCICHSESFNSLDKAKDIWNRRQDAKTKYYDRIHKLEASLVKCSKCGSSGIIFIKDSITPTQYRIECSFCFDFETDLFNEPEQACTAWNNFHGENKNVT